MRVRNNQLKWVMLFVVFVIPLIVVSAFGIEDNNAADLESYMLTPTLNPTILTPRPYTLTPSHTPTITLTPTPSLTPIPTPDIDLNDYTIWYMASEDILTQQSLISVKYLFNDIQIEQITTAEEFDSEMYPDVLLIHHSAGAWLDQEFVAEAVRHGVILATIDVAREDRADWMDSECMRHETRYGPLVGQYEFTIFMTRIEVMTEEVADAVALAHIELNYDCSDLGETDHTPAPLELIPEFEGPYFVHGSTSTIGIERVEDTETFRNALKTWLRNRQNARENFQERFSEPTHTPSDSSTEIASN